MARSIFAELALMALRALRKFVRLDDQQSAAWDVVEQFLETLLA